MHQHNENTHEGRGRGRGRGGPGAFGFGPEDVERLRRRHGGFGPGGPGGGGPRGRGGRGPRGRGPGGPGGLGDGPAPSVDGLTGWIVGRLPSDWFVGTPEVTADRDEVLIVGTLPPLDKDAVGENADAATTAEAHIREAEAGRITRFREESRDERIAVAREIEQRYGRLVAWGAQVGDTRQVFTSASIPVMTRLRQQDRIVLDTLVDAGVARSRSDALAWSVRLVGRNAEAWLGELREALSAVEKVRANGPDGAVEDTDS